MTCDFQQCGILTSVNSDKPVQPSFKLRTSKWCSVSSLTLIEYSSDKQRLWSDCRYVQADLRLCWSYIPHCSKTHATALIIVAVWHAVYRLIQLLYCSSLIWVYTVYCDIAVQIKNVFLKILRRQFSCQSSHYLSLYCRSFIHKNKRNSYILHKSSQLLSSKKQLKSLAAGACGKL